MSIKRGFNKKEQIIMFLKLRAHSHDSNIKARIQ